LHRRQFPLSLLSPPFFFFPSTPRWGPFSLWVTDLSSSDYFIALLTAPYVMFLLILVILPPPPFFFPLAASRAGTANFQIFLSEQPCCLRFCFQLKPPVRICKRYSSPPTSSSRRFPFATRCLCPTPVSQPRPFTLVQQMFLTFPHFPGPYRLFTFVVIVLLVVFPPFFLSFLSFFQ